MRRLFNKSILFTMVLFVAAHISPQLRSAQAFFQIQTDAHGNRIHEAWDPVCKVTIEKNFQQLLDDVTEDNKEKHASAKESMKKDGLVPNGLRSSLDADLLIQQALKELRYTVHSGKKLSANATDELNDFCRAKLDIGVYGIGQDLLDSPADGAKAFELANSFEAKMAKLQAQMDALSSLPPARTCQEAITNAQAALQVESGTGISPFVQALVDKCHVDTKNCKVEEQGSAGAVEIAACALKKAQALYAGIQGPHLASGQPAPKAPSLLGTNPSSTTQSTGIIPGQVQ